MSKRRLKNEIDERNNEILGDLEPDQRLQLFLEAQADGNEQWTDRLIETCPQYDYTATDYAFTDRARLAQRGAYLAVYELHTTWLYYVCIQQQQYYTAMLNRERDEKPSDEELNQAVELDDTLQEVFASLYASYYAYRWFATEIIGTEPETWLALHPDGPAVFEAVTDVIDDELAIELAESYLNNRLEDEEEKEDDGTAEPDQTVPADDHEVTLEDVAVMRYVELASVWESAIAEIS